MIPWMLKVFNGRIFWNGTQYKTIQAERNDTNQPNITYVSLSSQILSIEYPVLFYYVTLKKLTVLQNDILCISAKQNEENMVMHPHHQAQISKTTHTHMSSSVVI